MNLQVFSKAYTVIEAHNIIQDIVNFTKTTKVKDQWFWRHFEHKINKLDRLSKEIKGIVETPKRNIRILAVDT